jgi:hypothetical protein
MTLGASAEWWLRHRCRCLSHRREGRHGRKEDLREELVEGITIDFGTDQGEGIGTGETGVRHLEERGQPRSAQASPVRTATDGGLASELGQDDEGEDSGERVAAAAALARIREGGKEEKERSGVDGERSGREDEGR